MPLHSRSRNILNFSCLQRCASKMRQKSFKRYIHIRYSSCLRKTKGLFATFTERAPVVLTVSTLFYACFIFFSCLLFEFFHSSILHKNVSIFFSFEFLPYITKSFEGICTYDILWLLFYSCFFKSISQISQLATLIFI